MKTDMGDVATRARGLARHLLSRPDLERLTRASGNAALGRSLESAGYWSAPSEAPGARSSVQLIDAAIVHETARRLGLLQRWLAGRLALFAGVFEQDERSAIRIRLRRMAGGGDAGASEQHPADTGIGLPRHTREALDRATGPGDLVKALRRIGSPYAEPLGAARRAHGDRLLMLEVSLDRCFAERARRMARPLGGRLVEWVMDGIDLENAWSAAVGQSIGFIDGGRYLSREQHAAIAAQTDVRGRRLRLAEAFSRSALSKVFEAPELSLAALEGRALNARIANERKAGRRDPIGPSPLLECVMRMRAECADLRRINWGIAAGLPSDVLVEQLVAAT